MSPRPVAAIIVISAKGASWRKKKVQRGVLDVVPSAGVNHHGVRRSLPLPYRAGLPRADSRSPFTGEDGLRRREGPRARHSTVHSGHIIMTFTRPAR